VKKLHIPTYTDNQIRFITEHINAGLTYQEVAELFNQEFAEEKTWEAIRKVYKRYGEFEYTETEMVDNIRAVHSARKAKSRISKENRALLEAWDNEDEFLEVLEILLAANPPKAYKKTPKSKKRKKIDRVIFAHLSDTHFHSMIDGEEMGDLNNYTAVEEARRLAYFFSQVADYKFHHRDATELVLALNGDLTQGIIHDQESTPVMATQFSAALHLLTQGISYLAQFYDSIRVLCTPGNHGRFMHKGNKGRQTKQKWDGFDTMLHRALEYSMKEHKNVKFEIPTTPYISTDIMGHHFFITHGDSVISPGNVGKTIASESIKNKINDLNSGLKRDIDVVVMGHVHVPTYQTLNNGCELVVNGTMSGTDEFAQSIGIFKSIPTQQMFEITKDHAVGDIRFVRLAEADKVKELDNIIEPFTGKF